jgi:endonuclease-3 related protein
MVGAVLTQNTAWRNVEKAVENLRTLNWLTPEAMAAADPDALAQALRPSGYFNLKKNRLLALVELILAHGRGGRRPELLDRPADELRAKLLQVKGIGPETADSIVLYAAGRPSFVVDLYTRRLLSRHGLASGREPYEALRAWLMDNLPPDVAFYNECHALIVAVGHQRCGPKRPLCRGCPLEDEPFLAAELRA